MKILHMRLAKVVVLLIIVLAVYTSVSLKRRSNQARSPIAAGNEFNHSEDANESWVGPPVGEKIDLIHLKDGEGNSLSNVIGDGLAMLVLIDPGCGAPKGASDQLEVVHKGVKELGVQHYFISFTASGPSSEFFSYAHSLIPAASPAFLWQKDAMPPEKLYLMVLPSHILIDRNGVILKKWPGTSKFEDVRTRMAKEILADTANAVASRSGKDF